MRSDTVVKCHILAVLWKDKTLGREKKEMQPQSCPKVRLERKSVPFWNPQHGLLLWGNTGKDGTKLKPKPTKREDPDRLKHPSDQMHSILVYFHLLFKIPGTSFHPLLPIGICSPLIICHLEKLCLNSVCICPLLSVYLWCLNMVLDITTALHLSTNTPPSQKNIPKSISNISKNKHIHHPDTSQRLSFNKSSRQPWPLTKQMPVLTFFPKYSPLSSYGLLASSSFFFLINEMDYYYFAWKYPYLKNINLETMEV